MEPTQLRAKLDAHYKEIKTIILSRQHPVSGLLPASTAVNEHGDYRDAWVRDNVYSIIAVWGLALAYRQLDDDDGRGFELEQATVKLMRGLLFAMMRQSYKVEAFKLSLSPLDALHAKYDTASGDTVVADDAWGHLQLDATSLYLLTLAQMIASGLTIIYTLDEVNFIQNLVFYIGRAYRTPDYGIWERGDKTNHGAPELNASSIAMAKAALEALSGFNLFGMQGSQASVIHVLPDEIARARITLEALLPRESSSKEVDAALLSAISFPAFALEDVELVNETRQKILSLLEGRYGLKRFLRDGHQTVIEDPERLHYQPEELKQFEAIESQWPLFFCYLVLDGFFNGDKAQAERYLTKLANVAIPKSGQLLLPELYFVPEDALELERANPGSQTYLPNDNLPLVWAQSLYSLGRLLDDGLLSVYDLDPLGRHRHLNVRTSPVVQMAVLAEDEALHEALESRGLPSQTPADIAPIRLRQAAALAKAYYQIGRNDRLGLTGRPLRRLLSLSTSQVFRLQGELVVSPPAFWDRQTFYLSLDPAFLVNRFRSELSYIQRHWTFLGRPTVTLVFSHALFDAGRDAVVSLLDELRSGSCNGVPVKLGPLALLRQRAKLERIDNLHDFVLDDTPLDSGFEQRHLRFSPDASTPLAQEEELTLELEIDEKRLLRRLKDSSNLYEQAEILAALKRLLGLEADLGFGTADSVRQLLEEVYTGAADLRLWAVLRRSAGLLGKVDVGLNDHLTDILIAQKNVVIGKAYTERSLISRPMPYKELLDKISEFCREDIRDQVFTQEMIVYLSLLIKAEPELFEDFLTLRVGHLILLLTSDLAHERGLTQDEAYDQLMYLPPSEVQTRLRNVLRTYGEVSNLLAQQEALQLEQPLKDVVWPIEPQTDMPEPPEGWWRWRQREGVLNRVPEAFYPRVWQLMEHCEGLIIGDKLERRNRLVSRLILAEMTPGERKFALRVNHLLNKIPSPDYRQLTIEALNALWRVSEANPELHVDDYLVLDVLIGHAVRSAWLAQEQHQAATYNEDKSAAWAAFYTLSPTETSQAMIEAFKHLLVSYQENSQIT